MVLRRCLVFVVLLCVVSLVAGADSFNQQVLAQIQPMLQVVWPETELDFGQLSIGVNETAVMPLKILSNIGYRVELQTNSIYLKEFSTDLRTYGDIHMVEPLKVSVDGGITWSTIENAMVIIENSDATGAEDIYNLKYQQVMTFPGDKALEDGNIYKTDITILVTPVI